MDSIRASRLRLRLAAVLLLPLAAAGCAKKAPAFQRPPAPVTVVSAASRDVPIYLDEVGKVVAREVVTVQPQVGGRILEIHFEDGADLKKGELLFTIDPEPYRAALASAEANVGRAKAVLDLARVDYARIANLVATQIVAQADYDAKKSAVQVNEAELKQAQAAVETARISLQYCTIRSPIDGRAGHRLVDRGNVVAANASPLLVIQRLEPIYVDFSITEQDLAAVQRHMAGKPLAVEVRIPDQPDDTLAGEVTFLDNAVQEGTGTVTLRATVGNPRRRLWPGRFVKVRLVLATIPKAVVVPAAAPQMSAKGPFVYVVKEDDTAELRPVKPGQRQGDLVVLEQGVKAGERVVVNGQLGVTPGGKVKIEAPQGSAPAAPKAGAP
ncbi:MAG TPA: efflux RND transporter periplasmic adaptor subunit [Thermoanaerobaculia bacterium]|nr:efflux RND transporter periplasmic adaptor subunit [Thermoanaerobaculia bacterium]